jgi:hypothetical protein
MEKPEKLECMEGGCQCGNIRYRVTAGPIVVYACHCTDCQKQSSSAFGISVWVEASHFELLSGQLKFWQTIADSGNSKLCGFCPTCGSRIYHVAGREDKTLSLKGGSLDNAKALQPIANIWMRSAPRWITQSFQGHTNFQTEPRNYDELIASYKALEQD